MRSQTTPEFWECYRVLSPEVRRIAVRAYQLWRDNPRHPSLHFKCVHPSDSIYSVRVGLHWRALGLLVGDTVTWFWIGSHADYDRLVG